MTTTIGSLDLNAFSDLYSDSNQYFWFESNSSSAWGSGAHVTLYPESQFTDSTNPNYMKGQNIIMNTDGFSIRNGALPMMTLDNDSLDFNVVDTTQGTYTNVASFGAITTIGDTNAQNIIINSNAINMRYGLLPSVVIDNDSLDFNIIDVDNDTYINTASFGLNTRIGRNDVGYAKILLSPDIFTFLSSESTSVFNTGVSSDETAQSSVLIDVDWDSPLTTGLQFGEYTLSPNDSTTVNGTFYSSIVNNLDTGTRFGLNINTYLFVESVLGNVTDTHTIFSCTTYGTDGFTKGTSQTLTNSGYHGLNTSVFYDGAGTFTISGTITNYNTATWNISRTKGSVGGATVPVDTHIYNTYIGGNTFINSSNGGIYLGLSGKNEERSSDYTLYQAINALGWNTDVLVGIRLDEHTKTIHTGGTTIDDTITFTMIPLTANVTITSSDTTIISGGEVDYYDRDFYFIALDSDYQSYGTTTITASITVGENTYSDSCVVTVTQ